jgi:hypothetical protein
MPYFPVDDQAPFHPKFIAAGNAAIGLWARAGAWCKHAASGGWLSQDAARTIGTPTEIKKLVKVGLWEPHTRDGEAGYLFHDWTHAAGNGTAEEETQRRDSERERNRLRQAAKRARDKEKRDAEDRDRHGVTPGVSNAGTPGPVTGSPSPSPSPTDGPDMTREPEVRPVATARLWTDQEVSPEVQAEVQRVGIGNLGRLGGMLSDTVRDFGALTPIAAVRLVESIVARSKEPVRNVDAYVAETIRRSPEDVCGLYESQDLIAYALLEASRRGQA